MCACKRDASWEIILTLDQLKKRVWNLVTESFVCLCGIMLGKKILTLDQLMKRDWSFVNRRCLCNEDLEFLAHNLVH